MLLPGDSVIYFKIGSMEDSDIQKNVERELVNIFEDPYRIPLAIGDFGHYEVMYSFLPEFKNLQMEAVFRKYNLLLDKKDITEAVLNGDIADHEFTTTFKDSIWADLLEYFLVNRLTVDDVLDKISRSGLASLSRAERKVIGMETEGDL